jgi:hypothetical protein
MSIERELQKNYQEVFYPPMPEPEVQPAAAEAPMQLAEVGATKMADYGYSGERQVTMTDYDPTMREKLSEFLQAGFEKFGMDRYKARQNAQTLMGGPNSNLPMQTGVADIVPFLGTALQTEEAKRMGEASVESAKQGNYGTAALEAGLGVVGMVPGAAGTIKAAKSLPKNLPVGMSIEAVGGVDGALKPASQMVVSDFTETLFKAKTAQEGESIRFKNPLTLKDGSRLSGFTNPKKQNVFFGYDKNGELFTIGREYVNPEDIVSSRDTNKTADRVKQGLDHLGEYKARISTSQQEPK